MAHYWYMDIPRNISAAVTGVATGLLGNAVPVVGLTGGIVLQLVARDTPSLRRYEYPIEGVVDGSAALVAKALFTSIQARPMKLTLTPEELDKLEFEAAKRGKYLPPSLRPTKEEFKKILREKLLAKD